MRRLASLSFFVALAGCGWKADGHARLEQLYPDAGGDGGGGGCPATIDLGTAQCSGLSGRWAVRLSQKGTVSPLGSPWDITVDDLFIGSITGGGSTLALELCDEVTTMPSDLGRSQVPDALRNALAATPTSIPLPGDGTFQRSDHVWLWGLRDLASPLTDALPTASNYTTDPHLWDQDGDGHPGVTVHVISPAGDLYMVKRAIWTFAQGTLSNDNAWLTGELTYGIEQSVLDAVDALGEHYQALMTPAPISPVPGSVYQLRCVGETYDCAALRCDQAQLFSSAP